MYCATIKEVCKAGDVVNYRLHFRSTAVTTAGTRRNVPTIFVFHHLHDIAPANTAFYTHENIAHNEEQQRCKQNKKINYVY